MKRKFKNEEEAAEEQVSKKLKNEDEDEADDSDISFNIKKFRKGLKAGNFFDDLKLFLKKAAKTPEIIFSFVESGGKPLEIVEIIKSNEESSIEVLSNLYQMLKMVILHTIRDENQRTDSTVQALKYLVNKNKASVEKMLTSAKTADKISMLKILSIGVSLDREIGIDILKNIQLFAKSNENESFPMFEENPNAKVTRDETIRTAFVNFYLSYLINETDFMLCKRIFQKRALFEFFLQNLHKDDYETIKRALSCLTKSVLISSVFSKPEKLKIFSDNAIKSLLKLYEWKGDKEEKLSVVNLAHHFLILLLTSRKHGIVFKALTENRQNLRQLQVLNLFKVVWLHEYPSLLVIEIIKACPDLMQNLLNRVVMGLQPRVSTQWFLCANFTKELLKSLEPSVMINYFASLEPKKISSNIIKFSVSQFLLQNVNENALIQQDNLEMREITCNLLYLMLDRCCKYLVEVKKITTLKDFEQHRIRFDVINHIFTFFPHIDIILNSLYRSINLTVRTKSDDSEKLVKSQLKHTLEILLLIIDHFPMIIEKIPSVIDFLEMLRPIYEFQLSSNDNNEDLEIEMKVVKVILSLQPEIIALESEMFKKMFLILIQVYCCSENGEWRTEARKLLIGILSNTGIYSAKDSFEICIWLEAFKSVKKGILKESVGMFTKALRTLKESGNEGFKWQQENQKLDFKLFELIDSSETDDKSEGKCEMELSNVLPTLLSMKSDKLNRIMDFVEMAVIFLYHCHPELRKSFTELLKMYEGELNTQIIGYVKKKTMQEFPLHDSEIVYQKFQKSVVSGEKIDMKSADNEQIEILIFQAIFCSIQLSKGDKLDDEKINLLTGFIQEFYEKIRLTEESFGKLEESDEQSESTSRKANKIFSIDVTPTSKTVVSYIFEGQTLLLDEFSINNPNQMTKFLQNLAKIFKSHPDFEERTFAFRSKIVEEIKHAKSIEVLKIIESFPLSSSDCISVINSCTDEKINEFKIKLLNLMIGRLTVLQLQPLASSEIAKVEKIYVEASENTPLNMCEFEDTLLKYFTTFTHNIGDLSAKIFELAFRDELTATKSFIKLIMTIFARRCDWNQVFIKTMLKMKKEILYPMLNVAFEKEIISDDMLKPLYQEFKSGIIKALEKPSKAAQIYRENVETSVKLIDKAMPLNECRDLAMKKFKFDTSEVFQVKMLQAVFNRMRKDNEGEFLIKFIVHWMNLFALAKSGQENEFINVLDDALKDSVSEIEASDLKYESFENFFKYCLKNGLKYVNHSNYLVILGKIIRSLSLDPETITTIFDMILTHSNFFNVTFNMKSSNRKWKRDLFFLLNILVQKNPSIAHEKHIPIFLSSYQATMSSCDQLILNLLRFYELKCDIDLHEFRPFLFGPTALAHFTTQEEQEFKLAKKSIDDMNPVYFKLLNLFEKSMIENTVNNYPIKRRLEGIAAEHLDTLLMEEDESAVYDPGYFLPLFEMIITSGTFNFVSTAIKNGLMALVPPALSCEDENMRLLAARILLKSRESTESKKASREIWIRLYDSIQRGLFDVREGTQAENKNEKHFPRPASISTQIIAEFFNILPNKLHVINGVVSNYLIIKEKFEFATIPELLVLFHSHDLEHEEHRLFLLNAVFNGIKDNLDFKLLNRTTLLKMMLSCYGCPLSNRKIDSLILKIIDRLVTKTDSTKFLVEKYGLALWIFQACVKVEAFEYDAIEMLIALIENVFKNISRDSVTRKRLLASLLVLLPKFTKTRLPLASFMKFLTVVTSEHSYLNDEHRELIIDMAKVFLPEESLRFINYLIKYPEGAKFIEPTKSFKDKLEMDENLKELLIKVREFIVSNQIKLE